MIRYPDIDMKLLDAGLEWMKANPGKEPKYSYHGPKQIIVEDNEAAGELTNAVLAAAGNSPLVGELLRFIAVTAAALGRR